MKRHFSITRQPLSLALVSVLSGGIGGVAAQEANSTKNLDTVEVTGSRIRQADIETSQPVLSINRAQIQQLGATNVADVLQSISASGPPPFSRSSPRVAGPNIGGQYGNLRNLGVERTLILIDGKRMGTNTHGYADLATIPSAIIDRIEVLSDGASALYGSDAIAGVINIITRKNFDGAEINTHLGQFSQGDGFRQQYSLAFGKTYEQGSFAFGAEYSKEDPVWAKNREFSRYPKGPRHPTDGLNGNSQLGVLLEPYLDANGDTRYRRWTVNPNGSPTNFADFHPTDPITDHANINQLMMVQTELERRSVFANIQHQISDNIRIKADASYSKREGLQTFHGYPYTSSGFATPMSKNSYFNPLGNWYNPGNGTDVNFARGTWEMPRSGYSENINKRFSTTIEGVFNVLDKSLDWDIGYVLSKNDSRQITTGNLNIAHVAAAVGPSFKDIDGHIKCGTADNIINGCIPWNPMASYGMNNVPGSLSDAALQDYLFIPSRDHSDAKTRIFSANLSGQIFDLPAGSVGMAMGYEHRNEEAKYVPDIIRQLGLSTDLGASISQGKYHLDEAYLEFNVPLLADITAIKELTLNLAGRYSNYNTFGNTTNYKFGLNWRPVEELLVRGNYATGFRAPTINDLYSGSYESYDLFTDPCDSLFGQASFNPAVAQRCQSAGLPANFRQEGPGGVPAVSPDTNTNYPFLAGSNEELLPETSVSKTIGFVYSPHFVEGLDISLDWWNVKIEGNITSLSASTILNQCYIDNIASSCDRFTRSNQANNLGQVIVMNTSLANAGFTEIAGYDFSINYRLPELQIGKFIVSLKGTYVDYVRDKFDDSSETKIENSNGYPGNFRLRSNLNIGWSLNNIGINWGTRYFSSMMENCSYSDQCERPDRMVNGEIRPTRKVGSNTFHDVQFSVKVPWNATIMLGANNVFDHLGPTMYSNPSSSFAYYGGFDIGRYIYMQYQQRF